MRHPLAFLAALAAAWMVVGGYFRSEDFPSPAAVAVLLALALLLVVAVMARLGNEPKEKTLWNVKFGLLLIVASAILLQVFHRQAASLFGINYLLAALLVAFNRWPVGLGLVAFLIALDWGQWLAGGNPGSDFGLWFRSAAMLLSSVVVGGFYKREYRQRLLAQDSIRVRRRSEQDLLASREGDGIDQLQTDVSKSGIERLRQRITRDYEDEVGHVCELLRQATHSTAALLMRLDPETGTLIFWEGNKSLDDYEFNRAAVPVPSSIFALLINRTLPVLTKNWDQRHRADLPYYRSTPDVKSLKAKAFTGADGKTAGVLVIDSLEPNIYDRYDPVPAMDMAIAQIHAMQKLQGIQLSLEEDRQKAHVFKTESERLNETLNVQATGAIVVQSVCRMAGADAAVLAMRDRSPGSFEVIAVRVERDGWEKLQKNLGKTFDEASGFVGPAVLRRYTLEDSAIAAGDWAARARDDPIFSREFWEPAVGSLLSAPLVRRQDQKPHLVGCLTLLSAHPDAFAQHEKTLVGTYANMVTTAMTNARNYEEQLEKATTDGLTGLHNHRYFQEWLDKTLLAAQRYPENLALILADIDKFKQVNDTWGHPAGDEVLRRVARVLEESARELDLTARYGGEEFAIVMRQTDPAGARKFAERVRKTVEKLHIPIESGEVLNVTLSLGVALWPRDAQPKSRLIELADQSLYYAKQHGRNQVVAWSDIPPAEAGAAAR